MKKRIALVTGVSRKKGIGRAICLELAKQNIDIFFTYWTSYDKTMPWNVEDNEQEYIQKEIKKFGVKCEKFELDLTKNDSIELLFSIFSSSLHLI